MRPRNRWWPYLVRTQRDQLQGYLDWLHAEGLLAVVPTVQSPQERVGVGRAFVQWLETEAIPLDMISPSTVNRFLAGIGRDPDQLPRVVMDQRVRLRRHLEQLRVQGQLAVVPELLLPRRKPAHEIAPFGGPFLETLRGTLKKGTCASYRACLHRFHRWLNDEALTLVDLTRQDVQRWHRALLDQGLKPPTRTHLLIQLRAYLRWLHDDGHIGANPDELIHRGDMPKLPQYLPRPLPPDTDRELQKRLAASSLPEHQGLLLLRWTGMRIGELVNLHAHCVREDATGYKTIKVPLGKLNTERLVPIDTKTQLLIARLLDHGERSNRRWLNETLNHKKRPPRFFRDALRLIAIDLDGGGEAITPHRLRHTYATTLLAGGMSLVGLMKLLGHSNYRMTLRYAAITQETVRVEYFAALESTQARYAMTTNAPAQDPVDPQKLASDLVRWLKTHAGAHPKTNALLKRLRHVQEQLARIRSEPTSA